ncbi:hypothetical protein BC835DRAFT_1292249 [Cytidiella melzeri]|nr:hypothetical protein BC835DRAFT_1292249 [Cytidiella melzeri]
MEREEFLERQEAIRDREQFDYRRQSIPHHRFSKEEVPYMQSYSHISLHNDFYTYELLHYLTPPGSVTFHNFGDNPPRDVLDLGCGEGYWAAEAATVWKAAGTVVTAFDILDLGRPLRKTLDSEIAQRVIWVKDNFLKQSLPFPPKSFDLVRMANLTLAIPENRWSHILKEVKRVLRPGGIVEIIDDEIFFPSVQPLPTAASSGMRSLKGRGAPQRDADDHSQGEFAQKSSRLKAPGVDGSPRNSRQQISSTTPAEEHRQRSIASRTMETVFQNMLHFEYDLSPRPHEFLESKMIQVFDGVTVEKKEVAVPKRDLNIKNGWADDIAGFRPFEGGAKLRKGKRPSDGAVVTDFTRPAFVAPKAAQLLQLETGSSGSYQPSGYVISPAHFIPCEPDVLEMHACRNSYILLSCKDALGRYIEQQHTEDGAPMISDDEFEELVFEYDCFKRRRMNWPQDYPSINFEEDPLSPTVSPKPLFGRRDLTMRTRAHSMSTAANIAVPKDAVIPVRRIRAFMGRKSDPKTTRMR